MSNGDPHRMKPSRRKGDDSLEPPHAPLSLKRPGRREEDSQAPQRDSPSLDRLLSSSSSSRCCCVVVVFFVVASCGSMYRLTQQILPATHLIANSGDDKARSRICVMPSRRQNRRLEKTARLIVAKRAAGGGALKMGADGNGDSRQSLVRLFFLSFFALRVLRFPPE
jgi:hypothetical protein